jgi:hypothetical protein
MFGLRTLCADCISAAGKPGDDSGGLRRPAFGHIRIE